VGGDEDTRARDDLDRREPTRWRTVRTAPMKPGGTL